MIRTVCTALAAAASATQVAAMPCVSSTFDVPYPGATDVTSHVTDLPSPTFSAFWQEGRLNGYAYRIFANATGVVRGDGRHQPWAIDVTCDFSAETCAFTQTGTPPEPATGVAERIGQCLVPAFPISELADEAERAQTETSENASSEPTDDKPTEQVAAPCGIDAPFQHRKRGVETKLILTDEARPRDETLFRNIARAHRYLAAIKSGKTFSQIAKSEGVSKRRMQHLIELAFLAPDIVRRVHEGQQPIGLTNEWLIRNSIPSDWSDQRELFATL